MTNISLDNHGALVQLSVSVWSGRVKFPAQLLNNDANPDWLRATKALIDRNALKPIEQVRGEARTWLTLRSLSFPINGVAFVPYRLVTLVDQELERFRTRFETAVDAFTSNYRTFVEKARAALGDLYNPAEYPASIAEKFGFRWRFFQVAAPTANALLDPEIVRRQQAEFTAMMGEFRAEAAAELRDRFSELVEHVTDRLTPNADGSRKVFRDTLVTNFETFLADFSALNLTGDTALTNLVEQARSALSGVNPRRLRDNKRMQERIAETFGGIKASVDTMMVNAPSRRIRVPRAEETQ